MTDYIGYWGAPIKGYTANSVQGTIYTYIYIYIYIYIVVSLDKGTPI